MHHQTTVTVNGSPVSPPPTPEPPPPPPNLMEQIVSGSLGPLARLQESIDLTLDQVAAWIRDPANRDRVVELITMLDAQAQLMVSQHRVFAVAKLAEIAASEHASPEVARRAARDLLRLRLIDPYREDRRPRIDPDLLVDPKLPPATEEAILAALERLGTERDDEPSLQTWN